MATLVCFHAHPDDEAIATGGTMRLAADAGHRVILVTATDGSAGEVPEGLLADDESLADRRATELREAAELLGVHRLEFLGYRDSGMAGEASNEDPASFWQADVDEAAERLAVILRQESADVLTCYDSHGGYGHPDHIQVHRVGHRAAELAGVARVFESTINRDRVREHIDTARKMAEAAGDLPPAVPDAAEVEDFGVPESQITTSVDVVAAIDAKRAALVAHRSQIGPDSFFLAMPDEAFREAFGTEWFIRTDVAQPSSGERESSLFAVTS